MYWRLTTDEPDNEELALMGREPDLDDLLDDFLWIQATTLTVDLPTPLEFYLDPDEGDFIPVYFEPAIPLMNAKMLSVLADAGVDNIQSYEAIVFDKNDNKINDDYFAVNIVGRIECVDMENSEYREIEGSRRLYFRKIIIDEAKTHDALLFRLHESPSEVIIHDTVKQRLENENLPGLDFIKASV